MNPEKQIDKTITHIDRAIQHIDKCIQIIDDEMKTWNQSDWEQAVIDHMTSMGWVNDRNDETTLGFSFLDGEHHWIRDYNKKNRSFVHFNGNQKVNLLSTKP